MRTPWLPRRLIPLAGCALALWAAPAFAEEVEEEVDELPSYALEELDAAWAGEEEAVSAPASVPMNYGADIPSPEDVMHNRVRSHVAPAPAPAPAPAASTEGPPGIEQRPVFDDFYHGLASHGRWVETPEYGWVFVPDRQREVRGWRPYLYGQWIWTRYGWTWVSEEPFGWATYHYGRWAHSPAWGWYWVPGYVWGPAWVVWRHGAGSIGWAPLYPGYVSFTVGYPIHYDHWIFVGSTHFYGRPVYRHWVVGSVHHHWRETRWASHWRSQGRVYAGPPRRRIEHYVGRPVREVRIVRTSSPSGRGLVRVGERSEVRVYRPGGQVRSGGPDRRAPVQRRPGSGLVREAPAMRAHRPVRVEPRQKASARPAPVLVSPGRGRDGPSREARPAPGLRAVPAPKAAPSPGGRPVSRGGSPEGVRAVPAPKRAAPVDSRQAAPRQAKPGGGRDQAAPRGAPAAPTLRPAPVQRPAPSAPSAAPRPKAVSPAKVQATPAPRSSLRASPAARPKAGSPAKIQSMPAPRSPVRASPAPRPVPKS